MSIDIATLRPKLEAALGEQLQLGALLGQGGFAAVFRARDPFLERDVAIKVLDPSLAVPVDGRSDVYALGVVFYEMLTGTRPFLGRNATEVIAKHISAPIPKLSDREPETPAALVRLVERMLAKDPAGRPTAAELVTELTAASTPDGLLTPSQVRRRRWRRRGVYLGVAAVSAGLVIVVVVRIAWQLMSFVAGNGGGCAPPVLASGGG